MFGTFFTSSHQISAIMEGVDVALSDVVEWVGLDNLGGLFPP